MFPVLHLITGDHDVQRVGALDTVRALCSDCGPSLAVHLRVQEVGSAQLLELASAIREMADESGSWSVLNGRVDVALCARTHAVQLGRGALPVDVARDLLPSAVRIGASVHGADQAELRAREGCDYLVLGTMYPTGSHPLGPIGGPPLLRRCVDAVSDVPIVAIGGIDADRVEEVMACGAKGIAVNRGVWDHDDPAFEARKLLSLLEDACADQTDSAPGEAN